MVASSSISRVAMVLLQPNKMSFLLCTKNASTFGNTLDRKMGAFIANKRGDFSIQACSLSTSSKVFCSPKNNYGNGSENQPPHFKNGQRGQHEDKQSKDHFMRHPIWSQEEVRSIIVNHKPPDGRTEKLAFSTVQCLRIAFDFFSGYKRGVMDENKWLTRIILLETVAAVPGMVAAMTRHFHSLRKLRRDHGWIHTLLEEAENERMHLMTALELKKPGMVFRGVILLTQGLFVNTFFLWYMISPRFCHKFVAYLEEEAVKTYTFCLECIDDGRLPMWKHLPAPPIAKRYWRLPDGSYMRDVILAIRADEAHHRVVNHMLGELDPRAKNPLGPGEHKL